MPFSLANLFRVVVLLAMAVYAFAVYGLFRTMTGEFGFDLKSILFGALAAFVLMFPLIWAVGLPELPEILRNRRGRRRWERHHCPACNYPVEGLTHAECPECGTSLTRPAGYRLTARAVVRFVLLVLLAWALGTGAGELWTRWDEARFQEEVDANIASGNFDDYARPRRWPGDEQMLTYTAAGGIEATAALE